MDIQKIKELALANGFKLKEQADGSMDLNAYVYDFANSIEQAAKAQAVPEGLIDQLESTANFMRGMCFDPRLHHAIREAVLNHVEQIEAEIEAQGSTND